MNVNICFSDASVLWRGTAHIGVCLLSTRHQSGFVLFLFERTEECISSACLPSFLRNHRAGCHGNAAGSSSASHQWASVICYRGKPGLLPRRPEAVCSSSNEETFSAWLLLKQKQTYGSERGHYWFVNTTNGYQPVNTVCIKSYWFGFVVPFVTYNVSVW